MQSKHLDEKAFLQCLEYKAPWKQMRHSFVSRTLNIQVLLVSVKNMVKPKHFLFFFAFLRFNPVLSDIFERQRVEALSKLVGDIIEREPGPSFLCASTCWSKSNDIKFIQSLSIPTQIFKITTSFDLPADVNINRQWFFVDMSCEQSSNILLNTDDKLFAHPYRWIIVSISNDSIFNLTLLPDSNVIIANQDVDSDKYTLKQVYRIAREKDQIFESFGRWTQKEGLVDLRTNLVVSRCRRNLMGHRLVAGAVFTQVGSENHTDLDDLQYKRVDPVSKVPFEITKHWVESVNATVHFDVHRTWGYKDPKTGQFTGMSGQLQRKEADIGGASVFVTIDRIPIMEYLSMENPTVMAFVLRQPPISYVSNIYFLPFTGVVWICSISLVVLSVAMIASILKYRLKFDNHAKHMDFSDITLFAVASTCQMSSNILTNISSARISIFVFSLALLFLYISFTANIVSLLQSTSKSIRTIGDLQNPLIGIGIHDTPYSRHYFKVETEPIRKLFYDTRVALNEDIFMNVSQGTDLVRGGMFAFHVEGTQTYSQMEDTFLENEKCGLMEIRFICDTNTWSVSQKNSPYKEILKPTAMKIREHGIQARERSRIYVDKPLCDKEGQNFGSVRLVDCYAAMMIFIYGLLVAVLILCVEKFIHSEIRNVAVYPMKMKDWREQP